METIARLSHPNIVMAFDADEDPEGGHFLVMEFVDGCDLSTLVRKQGPFSPDQAIQTILQAARGLEYAHSQGIIHRDIKPANLLRDDSLARSRQDGRPGPGPFWALKQAPGRELRNQRAITQAGGILGTVDFMPPEQEIDSTTIDHRATSTALAATLHFLLLGPAFPYEAQTLMAILLKHREAPIPSLSAARRPAVPCRARCDLPADDGEVPGRPLPVDDRGGGRTRRRPWQTAAGGARPFALPAAERGVPLTGAVEQGGFTLAQNAESRQVPAPRRRRPSRRRQLDIKPGREWPRAPGSPSKCCSSSRRGRSQAIIRKYLQAQGLPYVVAAVTAPRASQAASGLNRPDADRRCCSTCWI